MLARRGDVSLQARQDVLDYLHYHGAVAFCARGRTALRETGCPHCDDVNSWPASALCEHTECERASSGSQASHRCRPRRRRDRGDAERKQTPRIHKKDLARKMQGSCTSFRARAE
jgi:hypothetical protein